MKNLDDSAGCLKKLYPISKLNFDWPIILMSNFIILNDSQHLKVLLDTSPNDFSQLEADLQQFH